MSAPSSTWPLYLISTTTTAPPSPHRPTPPPPLRPLLLPTSRSNLKTGFTAEASDTRNLATTGFLSPRSRVDTSASLRSERLLIPSQPPRTLEAPNPFFFLSTKLRRLVVNHNPSHTSPASGHLSEISFLTPRRPTIPALRTGV